MFCAINWIGCDIGVIWTWYSGHIAPTSRTSHSYHASITVIEQHWKRPVNAANRWDASVWNMRKHELVLLVYLKPNLRVWMHPAPAPRHTNYNFVSVFNSNICLTGSSWQCVCYWWIENILPTVVWLILDYWRMPSLDNCIDVIKIHRPGLLV